MSSIHTFRAKTLREALDAVRRQLGPDAAVLDARERGVGLMGRLMGTRCVEVTAAERRELTPPPEQRELDYRGRFQDQLRERYAPPADPGDVQRTQQQALGRLLERLGPEFGRERAQALLDGFPPPPDDQFDARLEAWAAQRLADRLEVTGPIEPGSGRPRVVALVGPTGVGKTTTIAKLAAGYRLRQHRRVGLVTVDTYRVAAVDQLRAYAEIIDLPMEVVSTPRQMIAAIGGMRGLDLVLIDTAGQSPRDAARLADLRGVLDAAEADQTHLVLSATSSVLGAKAVHKAFAPTGFDAILWTKLDESSCMSAVAALALDGAAPVSYVTDGQGVPDDISVAAPEALATRVLEARPF
ncbi:Flagellar biosynthesis protein FlhF [Pirellulimonas nuda]|uniref:Flagellar biosynthesis protein FlhF n=1 Tax=Pirellulimonas nuda TaxID=2528009 RepID=A0A518D883_9BACT|nr:flagellar biosynthesis protein FlhF [Pirellulimonas nuda]QDU87687.1 Flagellar biosynthesis protein FlhF [Pirellulimonas nuda]